MRAQVQTMVVGSQGPLRGKRQPRYCSIHLSREQWGLCRECERTAPISSRGESPGGDSVSPGLPYGPGLREVLKTLCSPNTQERGWMGWGQGHRPGQHKF